MGLRIGPPLCQPLGYSMSKVTKEKELWRQVSGNSTAFRGMPCLAIMPETPHEHHRYYDTEGFKGGDFNQGTRSLSLSSMSNFFQPLGTSDVIRLGQAAGQCLARRSGEVRCVSRPLSAMFSITNSRWISFRVQIIRVLFSCLNTTHNSCVRFRIEFWFFRGVV